MVLVGVLSDTHIAAAGSPSDPRVPQQVYNAFAGVELILHAGDLVRMSVIEELEALAPVKAVFGNCDSLEVSRLLPGSRRVPVESVTIGLIHGHEWHGSSLSGRRLLSTPDRAFASFEDVDCVVFGHSHHPLLEWRARGEKQVLLFNPGSPTKKGTARSFGCGLLRIDGAKISPELVTW